MTKVKDEVTTIAKGGKKPTDREARMKALREKSKNKKSSLPPIRKGAGAAFQDEILQ